ncbi:MAG: hypothetical protein IJW43_02540 [Clostridia bacterium]|nr:hypothetical protein [Clostridia bacterium]
MNKNIYGFILSFLEKIDLGIVFLVVLLFILIGSILNYILRSKVGLKKGQMLAHFIFLISLIGLESALCDVGELGLSLPLINLSLLGFLSIPFALEKRSKKVVATSEQKEIIKKAEEQIILEKHESPLEKLIEEPKKSVLFDFKKLLNEKEERIVPKKEQVKEEELSFSGVKKAIEKTLSKGLNEKEKNQVLALEFAIIQKERGEDNLLIKEQLNDGLSALIKIMAKYSA